MNRRSSTLGLAAAYVAAGFVCWSTANVCLAQTASSLPHDLQEVVKLAQAKMPDDIIKNYIVSTGRTYKLSADDIIYLSSQGVSPGVISALQTAGVATPTPPAPVPAPATIPLPTTPAPPVSMTPTEPPPPAETTYPGAPTPATPAVSYQYFHDQLAPYGTWLNVNGAMYWRPDQAIAVDPDWRPYYDMGQWVETDNGLYWQSDYTWGDIPFHYGRWILYPGLGWLWAPDYTWGPSWVFWRQDEVDGCIGWAPLPPGAVFVDGAFRFHGVVVGADFDFGLGESCFTFVSYDHFHEPFIRLRGHEWAWNIDRARLHGFYGHSVIRNEFRLDDHGRFVNFGIGHDRIDRFTHLEHSNFEERNPMGDRSHMREDNFHQQDFGHGQPQGQAFRPPSGGQFQRDHH